MFSIQAIFIGLWLAMLLLLPGCAGSDHTPVPDQLIPHSDGARYPGSFVWHDLLTPDVEMAQEFYGPLFSWEFEARQRTVLIRLQGEPLGSLVEVPAQKHAAARWIASLSVEDVDAAVAEVEANGGTVHEAPYNVVSRGRLAFVSDARGAQFVLLRTWEGDPEQDDDVPVGGWLWDELWTGATQDSIAFYKKLAPFSAHATGEHYTVLTAGGVWQAGLRELFLPELEQRWVPVIRVDNVEATAGQAEALGGSVVLHGGKGGHQDMTALLVDPQGALLIIQQWADDEAQEASR